MSLSFEKQLTSAELARLRAKTRELSRIRPWVSLSHVAVDWITIAAIVALTRHFFNPAVYVFGVFLIGTRQHALGVIGHEGAHYRLFQDKWLNTWVANVLCTYPLMVPLEMYRHNHLQHHQYTNQENDADLIVQRGQADFTFPMPPGRLIRYIFLDFLGAGALANWRRIRRYNSDLELQRKLAPEMARSKWIRIGYYAALAGALTAFGGWRIFLAYWVVPLLWALPALLRWRNYAEHYGLTRENDLQGTRDVACSWLEGWLLAPHYIRLHLAHHLYPSVPYYNLPAMRRHLVEYRAYREGGHENSTYLLPRKDAVWRDLISVRVVSA